MIDIHSHILPGVDDGARNFVESVEIIRELAGQGVTDIIATPHFMYESSYVFSRYDNSRLLQQLKKHLVTEGINVRVYLGNEIFIDKDILPLFKKRRISSLAGSKYLLVELPLNEEFPNYEDYLQELMDNGYTVVLAHPERYYILKNDYEKAKALYEMGCLFQCNLGSITGKYGSEAKKLVKKYAKDKMIFAFGNDAHRPGRSSYIQAALKKLSKYYKETELKKILETNPRKIIS
ncbi:hypothetical protein IKG38_00260 [Candidatus Saccharibacteria bacterium]|nr:hypothetical protein [Candidatus Saccharibacteria bacterium]